MTPRTAVVHGQGEEAADADVETRAFLLGLQWWELLALALAAVLPIAYAPALYSPFWAPKVALLLIALGPGLVFLVAQARARDLASIAALAFLAVAALSTLLADDPLASLVGLHEVDGGLVFVAAFVACWALGRHLGERARTLLVPVLIASIGVTAVVGWLQLTTGLDGRAIGAWEGNRAAGLQGNPVFFGALCAAAVWLVADRIVAGWRLWPSLILVVLFSGAVQLSGSRVALLPALVAVGWCAWRLGWRRGGALLVAFAIGVLLSFVAADQGSGAATQRASGGEVSGDLGTRFGIWDMGWQAFEHHPVLGAGPGRFRSATSKYMDRSVARVQGADRLVVDGHNVFVEYAATTGILGLVVAAWWLFVACRRVRGPLVGFAIVLGCSWLLQPQGVDTTPLLMLALGASAPLLEHGARVVPSGSWRAVAAVTLVIGVAAAGWLALGERDLLLGTQGSASAADRAVGLIGFYPVSRSIVTQIDVRDGLAGSRAAQLRAITEARRTANEEPTRADWWNVLGEVEGQWGSRRAASAAFHHALRDNPWSVRAAEGLLKVALLSHDRAAAEHWRDHLCDFSAGACPPRSVLSSG